MTKRPFDSGRRDSLGRRTTTSDSGQAGDASTDRPVDPVPPDPLQRWANASMVIDWLSEARTCVRLAAEFVSLHTRDEFLADEHLQNSGSMLIIRIREVERRLPDEFKNEFADVPWAQIRGMGNIVAHEYAFVVDMRMVWQALVDRFPELGARLRLDEWSLGPPST